MSESYGQCELNIGAAGNQFYNNLWQQAAAEGISVFVSSGDNGSAGCDIELDQGLPPPQPAQYGLAVNGIASTPYNVAVGGTDFNDYFTASTYWNPTSDPVTQESAKSYVPETTWNPSCTNAFFEDPRFRLTPNAESNCNNSYQTGFSGFVFAIGASGGASNCTSPAGSTVSSCTGGYAKPTWQAAPGVPSDGARDLPDVSLFASSGLFGSFYIICQSDVVGGTPCSTGTFVGVGGTSASSPSFAGLLALVDQQSGGRQGNPNYILYGLAAKQSSASCNSSTGPASNCVFNDITSGTIAMACVSGSPNCTTSNAGDQVGILSGFSTGAGYDLATGLGSVNASNLINDWSSVNRSSSTTALALNGGNSVTITHGTPVSVAISVGPSSPEPTGSASLLATQGNQSFGLGSFTLSNGNTSGSTNLLPGGASYSVRAHYGGDSNYSGSDSSSTTVTVNPEASETSIYIDTLDTSTGQVTSKNATTFPYGSIYLLRADVANSSGTSCFGAASGSLSYACPTGTVSFALDGSELGAGPAPLNSQGYTENRTIQLTTGSHSLTGNYSGDNSYLASSGTDSVSVTPAPTILGGGSNYPLPIGPFSTNILVRSANVGNFPTPPTGTFTIFDNGTQLPSTVGQTGPGVIDPYPNSPYVWITFSGNLYWTVPGPPGPHTLIWNYSGDTNYAPSTSGPFAVTEVYPTQLILTPSAPTIVDGQPLTVTAQVVPSQNAGALPSGSVAFSLDSNPLQTVPVINGQAQITLTSLSPTAAAISAKYSGDANYAASSASLLETINFMSTTTTVTASSASVTQNTPVTFTATVNPAAMGLGALTGSIGFTANGVNIGGRSVANNQVQITTMFSTTGPVQVQATYSGDGNYAASTGSVTETVTPPPDFSVTTSGTTTQTVSAGQTATFMNAISVAPLNGFNAQVNLSCSMPFAASGTTCTVTPSMLTTGSGIATVTVTTTSRGLALLFVPKRGPGRRPQYVPIGLLSLLLTSLLLYFARVCCQRIERALPSVAIALFLMLLTIGCGGGNSAPSLPPPTGTPAGSYTITVSGTSANVTNSASLTLIVT